MQSTRGPRGVHAGLARVEAAWIKDLKESPNI